MSRQQPSLNVVNDRLQEIKLLITDLEDLGPVTEDDLSRDRQTRHLAERELSQIIELASSVNVHIVAAIRGLAPKSYHDSFRELARIGVIDHEFAGKLQPSVGMRNVLVHEYMAIDYHMVATTIPIAIKQYTEYVRQVASWMSKQLDAQD